MKKQKVASSNSELPFKSEPLLTGLEEIELSRVIQLGSSLDATALQKRRAVRAKNRMIKGNMRLVMIIAHKIHYTHKCRSMTLEDLVQEGTFGLKRAAELFDPSRGYKFSTYAYGWINQSIKRAIADQDREIRLPIHVIDNAYKFKRAAERLGLTMSKAEIIESAGVNPKFLELTTASTSLISYNAAMRNSASASEICETVAAPVNPTFMEEIGWSVSDVNNKLLSVLSEKEKTIISMYYGLDGYKKAALSTIAKKLNCSRDTVTKDRDRAMNKLRLIAWNQPA